MASCRSNKDCLSNETCLNSICEAPTNPNNKLSTGVYVGIAIGVVVFIGIVVAICIRANRSSKKAAYEKSMKVQSNSQTSPEKGPAPLPRGYKRPVDLLQVAEQNRRMEEAEERKMIQEQQNAMYNSSYQQSQINGPYVTVPLSQLYVLNGKNINQGSVPTLYVDSRKQMSDSYGYPAAPERSQSDYTKPSHGSSPSNLHAAGISQFADANNNYDAGPQSSSYGKPNVMAYSLPVAPPRSSSPERVAPNASHSSNGSNQNSPYGAARSKAPLLAPERNSPVRNIKNLPALPNADYPQIR